MSDSITGTRCLYWSIYTSVSRLSQRQMDTDPCIGVEASLVSKGVLMELFKWKSLGSALQPSSLNDYK